MGGRAARGGRLPIATARTYTAELVTALGAIHACGAVYRDIKANNVVLDCAGRTKLIDFGFAKVRARCAQPAMTPSITSLASGS